MDARVDLADMEPHALLFMSQPLLEAFGPAGGWPGETTAPGADAL